MAELAPLDTAIVMMTASLAERAQRIRGLVVSARMSIIAIGQELIAAKAEVRPGEWLSWLTVEFDWDARTAQRYMQVADAFKCDSVSYLADLSIDATAFYTLSEPDVPQSVRDEAVELAKAGVTVTKRDALDLIEAARPEPTPVPAVLYNEDDNTPEDTVAAFSRPVHDDGRWQETMLDWINDRRDEPILLKDLYEQFADTIPLHDATRRWYFDFTELSESGRKMRCYAIFHSLLSLNVKFNPPAHHRFKSITPETEFTVPPCKRGGKCE
jgi:hypothetical protein